MSLIHQLFCFLCIHANDGIDDIVSIIFTFISVGQCVYSNAPFLFIFQLPPQNKTKTQTDVCMWIVEEAKTKQNKTNTNMISSHATAGFIVAGHE